MVYQIILNIDGSKATPVVDIPADILKSTLDIHLPSSTKIINYSLENGCFLNEIILAEVSPIFKKNNDLEKENHRPISILSNVSKVFEKIMYKQIDTFLRDELSKLLTGLRKSHST